MTDWDGAEGAHWAEEADRYTRMLDPFGEILVAASELADGQAVLDVGCGCGDVSLAAARAVGPSGSVTGVDLSRAMIEIARRRADEVGIDAVRFLRHDASEYRPAHPVDAVLSRFGVMFFDDPARAFANLHAGLRPGASLRFLCWQELLANEWMIVPGAAVAEVLPLPVGGEAGAPGPFSLADRDRVTALLRGAGFGRVDVREAAAPMWMGEDAEDAVAFLRVTGMGRALFAEAEPVAVEEAMGRAADALRPHQGPDGVVLQGAAWLVSATA